MATVTRGRAVGDVRAEAERVAPAPLSLPAPCPHRACCYPRPRFPVRQGKSLYRYPSSRFDSSRDPPYGDKRVQDPLCRRR
jgi:hypothetical protein